MARLFLGGAETVLGICAQLQPVPNHSGIYGAVASPPPLVRAAS